MIHLRALVERARGALVLAAPEEPSARGALPALSGVHMSELPDPTPYLDGGELLLTTGMPFTTAAASDAYFARLAAHGVDAVGFGVLDGEGASGSRPGAADVAARGAASGTSAEAQSPPGVPAHVAVAAARHGVLLLVVPEGRRFSEVSQAYWALVNESETASLVTSLGSQRALVRAALESPPIAEGPAPAGSATGASSPATGRGAAAAPPATGPRDDARTVVLRTLAQAVGGWTAYLPVDGDPPVIAPARMAPVLRSLGAAVDRVNANGVVGAATFRLGGDQVTEHPVLVRGRVAGFLALGAGRRPTRATRELVLAAVDALATAERIREAEEAVLRADAAAVAVLLARGHADAAAALAIDRGVPVPAMMRVLVVARAEADDASDADARAVAGVGAGVRTGSAATASSSRRLGAEPAPLGAEPARLRAPGRAPHELVAELLRAVPLRTRSGARLGRCDPAALVASLGADAAVWFAPVEAPPRAAAGGRSAAGSVGLASPALEPVVLPAPRDGGDAAPEAESESGDDGEPRFRAAVVREATAGARPRAGGGMPGAPRFAARELPSSRTSPTAPASASASAGPRSSPGVRAAASGPLDWHEAASAIARTVDAARRAAPGRLALASSPRHDVDGWMRVLGAPEHADLRATALSFLGAHTSWERASRELGVHRNTVRQRIARVEALLGVSLQDPDVTSRLWLALRAG